MKKILIRKILSFLGFIFFLFFALIITIYLVVSGFKPGEGILSETETSHYFDNNRQISIITWNMGYAGLGEESNFLADGGKSILPPSKKIVRKNIANITNFLKQNSADIYLFQEIAKKTRLIFNLNLWQEVSQTLPTKFKVHSPTVKIPWLPIIGRLETGNAIFSNLPFRQVYRYNLPLEEQGFLGTFQQKYNFILTRYQLHNSPGELVIINLHLAAFDEGGNVRKKQLEKLRHTMLQEFANGNYVVVGGDWNHRLAKTDFAYTADDKFQFWIHDLPQDFTPDGWTWAFDKNVPTVRTLEKPYHKGDNYTCIIDGFLLAPNVELISVKTFDLQFKFTDHHPVKIEIALKRK
jgi:endonuclease/exonuclease/phosphatase family metal-dependent hydrolase